MHEREVTGMHAVDAMTDGVRFLDEAMRSQLELDASLGFLVVRGAHATGEVTVLGFSPLQRAQTLPETTFSITELSQVPPAERTVGRQGKGVGRRLYNSPAAVAGLAIRPYQIAAMTCTLERANILDMRSAADATTSGAVRRIARHFGRIVYARTESLEVLTNAIHESYGGHDAVLFNQPPRARIRELMRHARPPVPSCFFIIRNSAILLRSAGLHGPQR